MPPSPRGRKPSSTPLPCACSRLLGLGGGCSDRLPFVVPWVLLLPFVHRLMKGGCHCLGGEVLAIEGDKLALGVQQVVDDGVVNLGAGWTVEWSTPGLEVTPATPPPALVPNCLEIKYYAYACVALLSSLPHMHARCFYQVCRICMHDVIIKYISLVIPYYQENSSYVVYACISSVPCTQTWCYYQACRICMHGVSVKYVVYACMVLSSMPYISVCMHDVEVVTSGVPCHAMPWLLLPYYQVLFMHVWCYYQVCRISVYEYMHAHLLSSICMHIKYVVYAYTA